MKEKEIFGGEFEKMRQLSNPIFWKTYLPISIKIDKDVYYDFLFFLETLSVIEQKILYSYISGWTQSEIGKIYHIPRRKISEILTKIKNKYIESKK